MCSTRTRNSRAHIVIAHEPRPHAGPGRRGAGGENPNTPLTVRPQPTCRRCGLAPTEPRFSLCSPCLASRCSTCRASGGNHRHGCPEAPPRWCLGAAAGRPHRGFNAVASASSRRASGVIAAGASTRRGGRTSRRAAARSAGSGSWIVATGCAPSAGSDGARRAWSSV